MRPLYVIIILGVLIGAGFYYRDTLAQKIADLYPSQEIPPTPNLSSSPTPTPTATAVAAASPTPAPSPTLASIAQLPAGEPLPKAGPELNLGLLAGATLVGGGTYRHFQLRRKLRDSLRGVNIL